MGEIAFDHFKAGAPLSVIAVGAARVACGYDINGFGGGVRVVFNICDGVAFGAVGYGAGGSELDVGGGGCGCGGCGGCGVVGCGSVSAWLGPW